MSEQVFLGFCIIIAAILFLVGLAIAAGIVWLLARGARDIQGARFARMQADAQQLTIDAAEDAVDEVGQRRQARRQVDDEPVYEDDAGLKGILAEREAAGEADGVPTGNDITTTGNEGVDEGPPIPPDYGQYNPTGGEDEP